MCIYKKKCKKKQWYLRNQHTCQGLLRRRIVMQYSIRAQHEHQYMNIRKYRTRVHQKMPHTHAPADDGAALVHLVHDGMLGRLHGAVAAHAVEAKGGNGVHLSAFDG